MSVLEAPAREPLVLELMRADHAPALLAFERENRAYFAAHVPDRGDAYFADFDARHRALLDEQENEGTIRFHVLVAEDGAILGRINLIDLADGAAELGYRIAESAAGRGLATRGVLEVCRLALEEYGLRRLYAKASPDNAASRAVLARVGFGAVGRETLKTGETAIAYELDLGGSFGRERSGTDS
ncbi:GNAT family N-acetyltransferase [Streptomyces sp. NPDC057854]|uniref:GNAT family N-acetyltransferase n=1 Tax=unclassified Streptomyces TaxID=2593676 RepID=UPI0036798DBD